MAVIAERAAYWTTKDFFVFQGERMTSSLIKEVLRGEQPRVCNAQKKQEV